MKFIRTKRPLLVLGWGCHLSGAEDAAIAFAEKYGIPVICTWAAADIFRNDHSLYIGTFGTHGTRAANYALQNADCVIAVGTRLDTKATGHPASDFARKARVWMCDIDKTEIDKFKLLGREINGVCMDAKKFLQESSIENGVGNINDWLNKIAEWKAKYPIVLPEYTENSPYRFVDKLSHLLLPSDTIVSDTGCSAAWIATAFKFKGQRFFHAWNSTPMGYGLPASIGAALATGGRIIAIMGDGGLGENVTEFATIARHNLNINVILFNNHAHAMCEQTERTWMGGKHRSTNYDGGLATPNYKAVAAAYELPVHDSVESLLESDGMGFYEFELSDKYQVDPQVKFGNLLDNASPLLPPEELAEIMRD